MFPHDDPRIGPARGGSFWRAFFLFAAGSASALGVAGALRLARPRTPAAGAARTPPSPQSPARAATGSLAPALPGSRDLTPAESRAIGAYLSANPGLRLAGDADARDTDDARDVAGLYGVYHPYFVRGDLDDDGTLDFAAAFVQRRSGGSSWFTVVVFRSDGRGGFLQAYPIESGVSLAAGDISIDRDCLVITPDLSEDAARRYRWNGARRVFDFVADEGDPDLAQRPSSRV